MTNSTPIGADAQAFQRGNDHAGDRELHRALAAQRIVELAAQEGTRDGEHRYDDAENAERHVRPAEGRRGIDAAEGDDRGQPSL
jgi:hypothetical protein